MDSSSSSSPDSTTNTFTSIVIHPNITLPLLIPPQITQKFSDFPSPVVVYPRIPLTRGKKQQQDASLEEALHASKKKRVAPSDSPLLSNSSPDILLCFKRKRKHIIAKTSKSSFTPISPSQPTSKTSSSSKPMKKASPKKASTVKGSPSTRGSSKSSSRLKKQVSQLVSSDFSDSDSDFLPNIPPTSFTQPDPDLDYDVVFDTPADKSFLSAQVLHFQKCKLARGRVVTDFGGPDMDVLLTKLNAQGWSHLFLQVAVGEMFSTTVHGKTINLYPADLSRILRVPTGGWGHYVKGAWPPLDNLPSAIDISRKFSKNPSLLTHRRVLKNEMSPLHQFYFDVVHKMILPRQEMRTVANFLNLTLMELLDSHILIDLPTLIIKHMQRVLIQDANGHALPYEFWLAPIFEDFHIPIKAWSLQTTKDVIGSVNHAMFPTAMRSADNPMQRLRNVFVAKQSEVDVAQAALEVAQATREEEKQVLQAQIASLTALLKKERAENANIIKKQTSLIPSSSST
ncbi:hypothetical protein P3L10_024971 [Capsicum annuum]